MLPCFAGHLGFMAVQEEYFYYDLAMGQFCNSVRIEIVRKSAHPYFEFHKHFFKFSSSTIYFGMYLRTMVQYMYRSFSALTTFETVCR